MSVGYGTHKKGRPLSPVEVGQIFSKAIVAGASLQDCADAVGLNGTSQVSRFVRVASLDPEIMHLVDWGRSGASIGFTTAVELARIPGAGDQKAVARAILEQDLQTAEVRQVAQILRRSLRGVENVLREVIAMRPRVERRYVLLGTVDTGQRSALETLTQVERNALFRRCIEHLSLDSVTGRLGTEIFTMIGDSTLGDRIKTLGRERLEVLVRDAIAENLDARHDG